MSTPDETVPRLAGIGGFERVVVMHLTGVEYQGENIPLPIADRGGEHVRVFLTGRPDEFCTHLDRGTAVAGLIMRGVAGTIGEATRDAQLAYDEVHAGDRRRAFRGGTFLVLHHVGPFPRSAERAGIYREQEDAIIGFDLWDSDELREATSPVLSAAVAALVVVGGVTRTDIVSEGVVGFRSDGKPVFSFTATMSGSLSVSRAWESRLVAEFSRVNGELCSGSGLNTVAALLASSVANHRDRLRSFLDAWTALEVFVKEVFPRYRGEFFAHLARGGPNADPAFVGRILDELAGRKWGVRTMFHIVAAQLCPTNACADAGAFSAVKNTRDTIHEESLDPDDLPVDSLQRLLHTYVELHIRHTRGTGP